MDYETSKNTIASPITNDTLCIKDGVTGVYFYLFICVILLYCKLKLNLFSIIRWEAKRVG